MMRTLILLPILLLLGCGATKQLDTMKDMNAQGAFAALAQQQVDCRTPDLACSQMHELKADACLREGRREARPGGSLRAAPPLFACAVQSYDFALVALPAGRGQDATRLRTGLLGALRERRDHGGDIRALNERMIAEATTLHPAAPLVADFYEATGRFGRAMLDRSAARCPELASAARLLDRPPPSELAPSWDGLRRAVAAERGGCA